MYIWDYFYTPTTHEIIENGKSLLYSIKIIPSVTKKPGKVMWGIMQL